MKRWYSLSLALALGGGCIPSQPDFVDPIPEKMKVLEPSPSATVRPSVPVKSIPEGWVLDHQLIAKWGMSLPTVLSAVPDSASSIEYWEDLQTLPIGFRLPIKRAKVIYQILSRLTIETVELQFVNVDHVYSHSNHEPSHYLLAGLSRTTELKPTDFPQLTADDILKHKILMEYGTPKEFDGVYHHYADSRSTMKVRVVDDMHIQIHFSSSKIEGKLRQAINEMYSEEGIEFQKKQLLKGIDI